MLITGLPSPDSMNDVDSAALVGSARGLESLARTVRAKKLPPLGTRTWDLLRWAATAQRPPADPRSVLTRRLAMAALVTGNQATSSVIERGLLDVDAEVRRFAAAGAATDAPLADRDVLLTRAMADKEPRVRLEALRGWGRHLQKTSCAPVRAALKDADPHVRLQAIDQLGAGCPAAEGPVRAGRDGRHACRRSRAPGMRPHTRWCRWRARSPREASKVLPRVRGALHLAGAHVCRSRRRHAGRYRRPSPRCMGDTVDNVREAALAALIELKRPEAVAAAIDSLSRTDYQLVLTAVRALEDKTHAPKATSPLVTALGRITKEHKDTSRDPRMAILNRLQALRRRRRRR